MGFVELATHLYPVYLSSCHVLLHWYVAYMDLFDHAADGLLMECAPLAERMRPKSLDDVVGQTKAIGPESFLRRAITADRLPSLLFWGPPGTGKTTLATLIARHSRHKFAPLSAVLSGVKDVRRIVDEARHRLKMSGDRTVLFVDEIHRFNKAQQDAFLPHVENGTVVLIGATTENPSFEVNAALRSRLRIIRLEPLTTDEIALILRRALQAPMPRGFGGQLQIDEDALDMIAEYADGDGRRALNLLEASIDDAGNDRVTKDAVRRVRHTGGLRHDKSGDAHYDVISAFIKSMRGSDPDAALYYLARLLEAGENPRFILRRLVIFASEDVGNADPRGIQVAAAAAQGFETVGMPEGQLLMAQVVTFLATCPKSNAAYAGLKKALSAVRETGSLDVPNPLKNAPTQLMADMGNGDGYRYPHDYGGYVEAQYLPDRLKGAQFYHPTDNGYESRIRTWMSELRSQHAKARATGGSAELAPKASADTAPDMRARETE